jgi:ribonuclease HI
MKHSSKPSPPRSARLFAEPHAPAATAAAHVAYVDGASRGNPGPASYAAILHTPDRKEIFRMGKPLGIATNNAAEYYALITALDYAAHHGIKSLRVRSDSELLVNQMNGRYRVRSKDLKPLHERAAKLANHLEHFTIEHVPREENREADALANEALDRGGSRSKFFNDKLLTTEDLDKEQNYRTGKPGETHRFRARYVKGALVPAEHLNLPEGVEVEITLFPARKK